MTLPAKISAREHDNDLLVAVAAGNRRALEGLYLSYHRRLARFAPRYQNVEEIINDTFMVVWQSAKDFRYASQVSTWIIGIAYRTALKSLRRQKNHTAAQSLEEHLTLELAYHMGHSLEEIAAITDCPVGTVKARMFHAREKLRQYLPPLSGAPAGLSARIG